MNPLDWLNTLFPSGKTALAVAGLVGYGIWLLSQNQVGPGLQSILAALAAAGLRHGIEKAKP